MSRGARLLGSSYAEAGRHLKLFKKKKKSPDIAQCKSHAQLFPP